VVYGVGSSVNGHPAGFDFVFGGAAEGKAGRQQPAGRQARVEFAVMLAALDQVEQAAEERGVAVRVLRRGDRVRVLGERVTGSCQPASSRRTSAAAGGRSSSPAASKAAVT